MKLSELTAYAAEKHHIQEQYKWADAPGLSVLADPATGKWAALLMRQWDEAAGAEIQLCDLKCGRQALTETDAPWLTLPFRMKGPKWVGVRFDDHTAPEVVFRLFDRAVYAVERRGYTIVLEGDAPEPAADIPLPRPGPELSRMLAPERIRRMRKLYVYGDDSFRNKCENFCRQGDFMADYADDAPWEGRCSLRLPTYHDLRLEQLRGYFTWRAAVRRGEYRKTCEAFPLIYVYELLNGIGAVEAEDALRRMLAFEAGYPLDGALTASLQGWKLEFAVTHGLPAEIASQCMNRETQRRDAALMALRDPQARSDAAVVSALCALEGGRLEASPVLGDARGVRLLAGIWRFAAVRRLAGDVDFFTACFGEMQSLPWHPLSGAVYWPRQSQPDADYELNPIRRFICRGGAWTVTCHERLFFDRKRLNSFLRAADRLLRKYLKTGRYLRERPEEAWATPMVEAAVRAAEAAARPRIEFDFSGLERIRQDAAATRDSLLTEDDLWTPGAAEDASAPGPDDGGADEAPAGVGLSDGERQILLALLRGEAVDERLRAGGLLPSVVADAINEALFDAIGDSALACDGGAIAVVEDYREDLLRLLGGNINAK